MNKNNIQYILFRSVIVLLSTIVIFLIAYFSKNCNFLFGDDGYYSLYWDYKENIFKCLMFEQHGDGYIGIFLSKFLCFGLPCMLGLHPADFIGIPHGIIRGIFTSITILCITNFCVFFKQSKSLYLIVYSILIVTFLEMASNTAILMCYYNFYRYFFSLLFLCLFLYFLLKNVLIKNKKDNDNFLILASVSGFITGTSSEINIFSSVTFVFIVFFYSLFINKFVTNQKLLKSLKIYLDKNFYIPSLCLIIGTLLFTNSFGFHQISKFRGLGSTSITFSMLHSFITEYFKIYFIEHSLLWISISCLFIIATYFAVKRNEIKKIIFPVFHIISILITLFSLILLGQTNYNNDFWLSHTHIIFLFKILMLVNMLYLFSYNYKNISNIFPINFKKKLVFIIVFIIYFSIYLSTNGKNVFYQNEGLTDYLYHYKAKAYIMEKILRFYYLRNERPVLPKKNIDDWSFDCWKFLGENNSDNYFIGNIITTSYYPRIYKDDKFIEIGFDTKYDAIQRFYKLGGSFSKEELNNINFSRLFDKDFVLNQNYSSEEIKKLMDKPLEQR